jgi:hypothetical protein
MENNTRLSFKEKLFAILLCLALILPLVPIESQETDEVSSDDTWSDKNWSDDAVADSTGTVAPEEAAPEEAPGTAAPKDAPKTSAPKDTPKTAAPKTATPKAAPKTQGDRTLTALINKVIGYISQIGAVFGQTTGIRIGGTSVSAIALLVIARLISGRAPDWVRRLLYISGGTMVAGSGANIMELIMQFL